MRWRLGWCRQDIYLQTGDKPSSDDTFVASFATEEDAQLAVEAVNDGPYYRLLLAHEQYREAQK